MAQAQIVHERRKLQELNSKLLRLEELQNIQDMLIDTARDAIRRLTENHQYPLDPEYQDFLEPTMDFLYHCISYNITASTKIGEIIAPLQILFIFNFFYRIFKGLP